MISIIAALGRNRELGINGELLWRIPDDLKRFRALTTGHPVIMGRKTFESIGRALPERTNIVLTRDANWHHDGIIVAHSLEEAIAKAKRSDLKNSPRTVLNLGLQRTVLGEFPDPTIFIMGGAQIYEQALPLADRLCLTLIDGTKEADTFFPEYEKIFPKKIFEENHEWNGLKYTWVDLEK
ncbi:MAG: dihydrofolate reductase [Minisyncoccia bacterium]